MSWLIKFLASGLGVGFVPFIPGTMGTLLGIPIFMTLSRLSPPLYFLTLVGWTAFAIWVSHAAIPLFPDFKKAADPSAIVIDEVVGFLWAAGILRTAAFWDPEEGMPTLLFLAFVFFRLFDVSKIGPVGWVERKFHGSGAGVVLDDVAAGILAGVTAILFCILYPLVVYWFV